MALGHKLLGWGYNSKKILNNVRFIIQGISSVQMFVFFFKCKVNDFSHTSRCCINLTPMISPSDNYSVATLIVFFQSYLDE